MSQGRAWTVVENDDLSLRSIKDSDPLDVAFVVVDEKRVAFRVAQATLSIEKEIREAWRRDREALIAEGLERAVRIERARVVAEHWRDESLKLVGPSRMIAHPCALILAALDGESNPVNLGLGPEAAKKLP